MKDKVSTYCLLLFVLASILSSCIRDELEPCPPLSVRVEVTDKNYFNVSLVELEKPVDEGLPFNCYISNLRYSLKSLSTGEVVQRRQVQEIRGGEKVFDIRFDDSLPHGKYVLTVFASGRSGKALTFDESGRNLKLHPSKSEGADAFLTTDTLVYDAWNHDYCVGLERVKGKLLVLMENIPQPSYSSDFSVKGLYDEVTPSFLYRGMSSVEKSVLLSDQDKGKFLTEAVLSPSAAGTMSSFSLKLHERDGTVLPESENTTVKIEMRRNELTLLKYTFSDGGKPLIRLFVNDHWEVIHGMEID